MTVRLAVAAAAVPLSLVAGAWLFQGRLIYLPYGTPGSPAAVGLSGVEQVRLATDDGLDLDAWYVAPAVAGRRTAVLLLPGNAGNRSLRAPLAGRLARAGLAVLVVDYRGYAGNPGRPSEEGLALDALAAHRYLERRDDVDRIVVLGESLGAAVAVRLAGQVTVHAVVLRSPFTSLADVGSLHYPFLPVRLLLRDRFDVLSGLRRVEVPVTVVAGTGDTIVPPELSRRVAAAADAELVVVEGAGHNDPALGAGDALVGAAVAAAHR